MRARFRRPIIVAGHYDRAKAEWVLEQGYADLVAFGRPFISNPDLVARLKHDLPLAPLDPATLFGGGEQGYTTYPALQEA
jgi:N-ethylmaleimide reductase